MDGQSPATALKVGSFKLGFLSSLCVPFLPSMFKIIIQCTLLFINLHVVSRSKVNMETGSQKQNFNEKGIRSN